MKKLICSTAIFLLLFVIISELKASELDTWYQGVVVLEGNDVIMGSLKINERYNVVQVKVNNKIQSYPAWQIGKVAIHDEELDAVRNFVVLPTQAKSMEFHQFYEVIISGEITLLAKDKSWKNYNSSNHTLLKKLVPDAVNSFANNKEFYFFDGKNLIPMEKFRKIVFPAFQRLFKQEMNSYIKSERLNLNYPKDQIQLMKFFNDLYAEREQFVKAN